MEADQVVLEQQFSKARLQYSEWWNQWWVAKLGHSQHFEKWNVTKRRGAEDIAHSGSTVLWHFCPSCACAHTHAVHKDINLYMCEYLCIEFQHQWSLKDTILIAVGHLDLSFTVFPATTWKGQSFQSPLSLWSLKKNLIDNLFRDHPG